MFVANAARDLCGGICTPPFGNAGRLISADQTGIRDLVHIHGHAADGCRKIMVQELAEIGIGGGQSDAEFQIIGRII